MAAAFALPLAGAALPALVRVRVRVRGRVRVRVRVRPCPWRELPCPPCTVGVVSK